MTARPYVAVVLGGLAVGALTSTAQGVLPFELSSLANSAGAWSLAAFALCLVDRSSRRGAVLGVVALLAMVLAYAVASELRGYVAGIRLVVFWGLSSVVVGPALGLAAAWIRANEPARVAIAAGLIGGILIGEGVYGLTVIAATTSVGYWIGQTVVGLTIVLAAIVTRARRAPAAAAGLATAGFVAVAFWLAFATDPIALLG